MKIGSLFSGIGGLELGLERAGVGEVFWQVEVDPFCRAVLEKHWPGVARYEDVRTVRGQLKKLTQEQVDLSVEAYREGVSLGDLAARFSVSRQSMWDLLRRRITLRSNLRHGTDNHFYRGGVLADEEAHDQVESAIRAGKMLRQAVCEQCGRSGFMSDGRNIVQAHHDDYNQPLQVRWLCQPCHHEWHKHNRPVPRKEVEEKELAPVDLICGGFPQRARTSPSPAEAPASRAPEADFGTSTSGSSKTSGRAGSSSRTSRRERSAGCPTCGTACKLSDTRPLPSRFLPSTSERPTDERECSFLLPTPSAAVYGTSNNGSPHDGREQYALKGKPSLHTLARKGLLPGGGPPGPLSPRYVEWVMGFPEDWTRLLDGWTALRPSETPSSPPARKRSAK